MPTEGNQHTSLRGCGATTFEIVRTHHEHVAGASFARHTAAQCGKALWKEGSLGAKSLQVHLVLSAKDRPETPNPAGVCSPEPDLTTLRGFWSSGVAATVPFPFAAPKEPALLSKRLLPAMGAVLRTLCC
jgi:hypothetical protein